MAQAFSGVKASGVWTLSAGHLASAEYVTFGGKTYTFKNTVTSLDGDVYLPTGGDNAADVVAVANLVKAINIDGTGARGTDYGWCTVAHPTISAVLTSSRVCTVTAKIPGSNGNTILFVDATNQGSVDHAHLQNGADMTMFTAVKATGLVTGASTWIADEDTVTVGVTVYQFKETPAAAYDVYVPATPSEAGTITALANLAAAINANGTAGATTYYAGTLVHPLVTAAVQTDTKTVLCTARVPGVIGNQIVFSEDGSGTSMSGSGFLGGTTAGSGDPMAEMKAIATYLRTQQVNGLVDAVLAKVQGELT